MKRTETWLDIFLIKYVLKKLNYRVDGKSNSKRENILAYILMLCGLLTFLGELLVLKNVTLTLFLLNLVSLLKRIIEYCIENTKLKREYCRNNLFDATRKSSYELLLFILAPALVLLMLSGFLLAFFAPGNLQVLFYLVVVANMLINLASNFFNSIVALYRAKASYGESI